MVQIFTQIFTQNFEELNNVQKQKKVLAFSLQITFAQYCTVIYHTKPALTILTFEN